MSEKRKIVIKDVLAMLEDGKDRKMINNYYGLNSKEASLLWNHPSVKGVRRSTQTIGIEIVEEDTSTEEELQHPNSEVVDNPNFRTESLGKF